MAKFGLIIADTINEVYIGVTSTGVRHLMGKTGFEAFSFFDNKDSADIYEVSDIALMIQMLTRFQYYWLDKRGSFKAYGKKHHNVMDYIFDHYNEFKVMRISDFNDKLYQIFK
ncbi:MAG: hypothetical protein KKH92_00345 [Firmicutes bacterium]|nr:hypothetical protein [Bacillota bacterium]